MKSFVKYSTILINSILLITIPFQVAYPQINALEIESSQSTVSNKIKSVFSKIQNNDLVTFDEMIDIINALENDEFEDETSQEDVDIINNFLALLVRLSVLINGHDEELEKDLQALFDDDSDIEFDNIFYNFDQSLEECIIPAILYESGEMFHCKSWIKKNSKKAKKFIKKHKPAVIAVTTVLVSVVVVAICKTTGGNNDNKTPMYNQENDSSGSDTTLTDPSVIKDEVILPIIEEKLSVFKEVVNQGNLETTSDNKIGFNDLLNDEGERMLGAFIAHETLDSVFQDVISDQNKNRKVESYEHEFNMRHGQIDQVFATDQSVNYINEKKTPTYIDNNYKKNIYQFYGDYSFNQHHYDQAAYNFGKVIELDPSNYEAYLNRAYAYLQDGQFDQSLDDYNKYQEKEQKIISSKEVGFIKDGANIYYNTRTAIEKGIAEGILGSSKQLLSIAANAIEHPINTSVAIYEVIDSIETFNKQCLFHPIDSYKKTYNTITDSKAWIFLRDAVIPEMRGLIEGWESLNYKDRVEKVGYLIGKVGGDIFVPGAAAKAVSQGIKGAKEVAVIAKNLKNAEKVIVLEALAETGGSSGTFAEVIYKAKTTKSTFNTIEKYPKNITNLITTKKLGSSKKVIDSLIKETLESKGYFTSKYGLTYNEALDAGLKFLGKEYNEIGKPGTGLFRSSDGLRQFRIDNTSIVGKHSPNVPHFHLEIFERGIKEPIVNNHIILMEKG
jgi:tetratricopeptide (TPR) repeat protein